MKFDSEVVNDFRQKVNSPDFKIPSGLNLSYGEGSLINALVKASTVYYTFPEISKATIAKIFNEKLGLSQQSLNLYLVGMKKKEILLGIKKGLWAFSPKLIGAILGREVAEGESVVTSTDQTTSIEKEDEQDPLMKFILKQRKGNEFYLTADDVSAITSRLEITEQSFWEKLKKMESQGRLKRSGRKGEAILFLLLADFFPVLSQEIPPPEDDGEETEKTELVVTQEVVKKLPEETDKTVNVTESQAKPGVLSSELTSSLTVTKLKSSLEKELATMETEIDELKKALEQKKKDKEGKTLLLSLLQQYA
ncbi:MAG: hypothetical protein P4L62_00575 [Candidatus Pacebacteria bacterium]|nr:hypothetical protein [Candidatus Paceibacterota bacterium]